MLCYKACSYRHTSIHYIIIIFFWNEIIFILLLTSLALLCCRNIALKLMQGMERFKLLRCSDSNFCKTSITRLRTLLRSWRNSPEPERNLNSKITDIRRSKMNLKYYIAIDDVSQMRLEYKFDYYWILFRCRLRTYYVSSCFVPIFIELATDVCNNKILASNH